MSGPRNPSLEMISGAANTTGSTGAVWIPARACDDHMSLLAYPLDKLVAISTVHGETKEGARVITTLRGHTSPVNGLSWLEVPGHGTEIYSCSEDGTVKVWRRTCTASMTEWQTVDTLTSLTGVAIATTALLTPDSVILACSDSKGDLAIWRRTIIDSTFDVANTQIIHFPRAQTPHSLHLMQFVPNSHAGDAGSSSSSSRSCVNSAAWAGTVLLAGCMDARVHVSVASTTGGIFESVGALPGHEEWVTCIASRAHPLRCEDTISADTMTSLVATGSKDFKIRVWRFQAKRVAAIAVAESPVSMLASVIDVDDADADGEDLQGDEDALAVAVDNDDLVGLHEARMTFMLPTGTNTDEGLMSCSIFLETLLVGHEDWVTSVNWLAPTGGDPQAPPQLFSTSMDRNMILWMPSTSGAAEGVWLPRCRMGDVGGMLGGSVGGNLLGFTMAVLSPDSKAILGVGYGGSFHLYCCFDNVELVQEASASTPQPMHSRWLVKPFFSGHFDAVTDLAWDSEGRYVVSVSSDQTCRLWAHVKSEHVGYGNSWREISRPQIHGYNLTCLALAPRWQSDEDKARQTGTDQYILYSAGDEKLVRVYDAPTSVLEGMSLLCDTNTGYELTDSAATSSSSESQRKPVPNAYLPELGLTSRASDLMSGTEKTEFQARGSADIAWTRGIPPLEGQLSDCTLWPEVRKLFGHGNDIVCMALCQASANGICGRYLATACKARNAETAAVIIWDTQSMKQVAALEAHDSTVTCLQFSPCGTFLASSGKDRSLCLYERSNDGWTEVNGRGTPYVLYAMQKGAHKRIVWDLSWAPLSSNSSNKPSTSGLLLTASRDGMCKLWGIIGALPVENRSGKALQCLHTFTPFGGTAVTAISISASTSVLVSAEENGSVIRTAIGSENGDISMWDLIEDSSLNNGDSWAAYSVTTLDAGLTHGAAVRRMRWGGEEGDLLATCGDDHCVRIFRI